MTTPDPQPTPLDLSERERLAFALSQRFAPHVEAAATAVREAEQSLAQAREHLSRAREAEAGQGYRSDRLVFMRAAVNDEVEGLAARQLRRRSESRTATCSTGRWNSPRERSRSTRRMRIRRSMPGSTASKRASRPSVRPANGWKRPMPCTVASRTLNTLPARDLPSWSRS